MSLHLQREQRKPQTVAQVIIERIRKTYSREQASSNGIYYWPDSLPTPIPQLIPDPLVLFQPAAASSVLTQALREGSFGDDQQQRIAVLSTSLHDTVAQRGKGQAMDPLMRIPIGLVDMPEVQQRDILWIDLHGSSGALSGGPLLIGGSQNSGKATALQCALLWLFSRYTPQQLRCIVIDPNHDLDMFQNLPYLQDDDGTPLWIDGESDESIMQLEKCCVSMLTRRRQHFPQQRWDEQAVQQLWARGIELPLLLLVVSQYHSFVDRFSVVGGVKNMILKFIEARTMGAYVIISTAEVSSRHVAPDIMGKMGTKIGLFLNEQQRYDLLGRTPSAPEPIPGRGMVLTRDRSMHEIQLALPVEGPTEQVRYESLKNALAWLANQK
jgi:hypothetical protein